MSRPFPIVEARSRYLQHTGEYLPNGELHVVGASGAMKGIESQIQPTVYLEAGPRNEYCVVHQVFALLGRVFTVENCSLGPI